MVLDEGKERKPEDWVKYRAKCSLESVFNELVKVIKSDIDKFTALAPELRNGLSLYKCLDSDPTKAMVVEVNEKGNPLPASKKKKVRVAMSSSSIQAYYGDTLKFEVVPEWNTQEVNCDLIYEDQSHSLSQLSDRAIGDLLFSLD